jgi:Zn-dependent protease
VGINTLAAIFDLGKIDLIAVVHFLVALYLSITVHEAAHAWMAYRCGDDTARLMGRMTLNPIPHIDPIGTVLMPLMQVLFVGVPLIGWAKPVPVNPIHFRDMRRGEILVSLAGPAANFILAAVAVVACWLIQAAAGAAGPGGARVAEAFRTFMLSLLMLNLVLGIFNLIPIPPLDGSHILGVLLSREAARNLERFLVPPFNFIILLVIVWLVLDPVFELVLKAAMFLVGIWGT